MNMILIFKITFMMTVAIGCSSAIFIQSKDTCNLKRHFRDDIYQVTINDEAINKQFYLKEDAILIAKQLATREINKCAPRDFAD
jgi:hypothetical protein